MKRLSIISAVSLVFYISISAMDSKQLLIKGVENKSDVVAMMFARQGSTENFTRIFIFPDDPAVNHMPKVKDLPTKEVTIMTQAGAFLIRNDEYEFHFQKSPFLRKPISLSPLTDAVQIVIDENSEVDVLLSLPIRHGVSASLPSAPINEITPAEIFLNVDEKRVNDIVSALTTLWLLDNDPKIRDYALAVTNILGVAAKNYQDPELRTNPIGRADLTKSVPLVSLSKVARTIEKVAQHRGNLVRGFSKQ